MNRFRRQASSGEAPFLYAYPSLWFRSVSVCPTVFVPAVQGLFSSGHGLYFYLPISSSLTALDQILM